MRIYGITAMDPKDVIGKGNRIPWHISEEFKLFKKITLKMTMLEIMEETTKYSIS